jgi:hypothetical protein
MSALGQPVSLDYEEELLGTPPGFRRATSDSAVVQPTAMANDAEHLNDQLHDDNNMAQQNQHLDDSHLTPNYQRRDLLRGLKNPKLAGLGPGISPYTPVDLNVYLQADDQDHGTPTPSRISPSPSGSSGTRHLLPPLSASSSRSHSPSSNHSPSLSPLPTLSELRNLQRANSAAGRLMAMKKLMGQTPPSPTSLRRAGSLNVGARGGMMGRNRGVGGDQDGEDDENNADNERGDDTLDDDNDDNDDNEIGRKDQDQELAQELNSFGQGMLGSPTKQTGARRNPNRNRRLGSIDLLRNRDQDHDSEQYSLSPDDHDHEDSQLDSVGFAQLIGSAREMTHPPPSAFPRPQLGRSNTVGTGGGEERRSVIGRRMMERLGSRTRSPQGDGEVASSSPGSGAIGLQSLLQRAKERRENEARARQVEAERQQESVVQAEAEQETTEQREENHEFTNPQEAALAQGGAQSPDRLPHEEPGDESLQPEHESTSKQEEESISTSPPIILSEVVSDLEPRPISSGILKRDLPETVGRSSFEAGVSSDSDHQRGSLMFLETSGSEDSHQRYRQHSPYFGLGHAGLGAGAGQSLFAGPSDLARSVSQATARSGVSDKFEYEAHLRRSGSEKRTTRASMVTPIPGDVVGNVTMEEILDADDSALREDTIEEIQSPIEDRENDRYGGDDLPVDMPVHQPQELHTRRLSVEAAHEYADGPEGLLPPLPPFVNEHGGPGRDSTISHTGGKHSTTPSESSLGSSLSAIPFIVSTGVEGSPETRTPRMPVPRRDMSMSSFPAEVQDGDKRGSEFSTPGRQYNSSVNSPSGTLTGTKDSPGSASIRQVMPNMLDQQPSSEGYEARTHRRLGSAFEERPNASRDHEVEELDDGASPAKYSIMS